jgi:asparagine synthase (glutamine-hydrolysing)
MCGIAGVISWDEVEVRSALPAMVQSQAHRGPDDQGETYTRFGGAYLGLGHRRLSILDLSPLGHEPMVHPSSGDQLVFNGEIYNFQSLRKELELQGAQFQSHCDAEVLLEALVKWGAGCIPKLQGMFAFAFFDVHHRRLLLARDSIGIKPLYYAETADGKFVFASEVRSILASGLVSRELDVGGIAGLLAYGAVQHPSTLFREIKSLLPGVVQTIYAPESRSGEPLRTETRRYWQLPSPGPPVDKESAVTCVREILDDSVRDHLVSDVPVGVFLSSGLDSTIVAGIAVRHSSHIRSLSVGFSDQPDLSELDLARETARLFGLDHTEISVTGADALAATEVWLHSLDLPSMDGLNVFLISRAVHAQGITVALSGQGGDELFGGYPSFRDVARMRALIRKTAWIPPPVRQGLARLATIGKSSAVREKAAGIAAGKGGLLGLYFHRRRAMSDRQLESLGLLSHELGLTENYVLPEAEADAALDDEDIVWTVSGLETQFYLGNTLLRNGDANGMAHSLEIRVPFLDQRLLDYVLQLPGAVRLPAGERSKHLLRLAFPELLRPDLQAQRKRGFDLPVRRWMLGPLAGLCRSGLDEIRSLGFLRNEGVESIWRAFEDEPESPIWSRAFTLCVLGLYLRQNRVSA